MHTMTVESPSRPVYQGDPVRAATTLVFFALLLLVADVVGVRRETGAVTVPFWPLVHMAAAAVLAVGILREERWAWWGTLCLVAVALFLLAPVVIALVAGQGLTLLLTRLDVLLLCLEVASLLFLVVLLVRMHRRADA